MSEAMTSRAGLEVSMDRYMVEGHAMAVGASGEVLAIIPMPGGRPPPGTKRLILSVEDYGRLLRAMAGAAP